MSPANVAQPWDRRSFNQNPKRVALTINTELSSVLPQFDVLQWMTGPAGIDDGRVAGFGRGLDHEFGHTGLKGE